MAASPAPDSFLQKTTEELQFLVQHPELYHPVLREQAGRELRRRGATLPQAPSQSLPAESAPTEYGPIPSRGWGRWWPVGLLGAAAGGLLWWVSAPSTPPPAPKPKSTAPIVLEAVKAKALPSFEAESAGQVAALRRQLPAAERADTTATGRYLRMGRRYWLAENAAAHLTAQAQAGDLTELFPAQVDLGLERISWFMRAKVYNQHLTPLMEERLDLMQRGLVLRRNSLQLLKSRYQALEPLLDEDLTRANQEAADIGAELQGKPSQRAPIQGQFSEL